MPTTPINAQMDTHVINLDRSPQRWQHASQHLELLGIQAQRIQAIDGKLLTSEDISQHYDAKANALKYFWPLKPSEIACYMSHRKSMQTFLRESTKPYLMSLEDDIEFDIDSVEELAHYLPLLDSPKPVLVKLFTKRSFKGQQVATINGIRVRRPYRIPLGCVAQIYNRAAAQALFDFSSPFCMPIDVDHQLWWQHKVDVLCVNKSIVHEVSHQLGGTNIGGSNGLSAQQKRQRELGRSWFRFKLWLTSRLQRMLQPIT